MFSRSSACRTPKAGSLGAWRGARSGCPTQSWTASSHPSSSLPSLRLTGRGQPLQAAWPGITISGGPGRGVFNMATDPASSTLRRAENIPI